MKLLSTLDLRRFVWSDEPTSLPGLRFNGRIMKSIALRERRKAREDYTSTSFIDKLLEII